MCDLVDDVVQDVMAAPIIRFRTLDRNANAHPSQQMLNIKGRRAVVITFPWSGHYTGALL